MTTINGDLNNTSAERPKNEIAVDSAYRYRSFALSLSEDDLNVRQHYRPFLLDDAASANDWIAQLELSTVLKMVDTQVFQSGDGDRLKVLVLHGSMRKR
jgi:arsenic resistance protein ArsH